ncbi:hypothetical protein CH371_19990 [Leptospira wolffii]|uniref:Uncharacterized protein n=1 Tax=Leptospira wolffii TaxID=409998 RepID=A0A2M9Z6M9_9LEPT|nr:hypothetical protein CH371_19990 [Leptospira wolffii]
MGSGSRLKYYMSIKKNETNRYRKRFGLFYRCRKGRVSKGIKGNRSEALGHSGPKAPGLTQKCQ